ncbi:hypothetical protein Tco_0957766 [Tanacetum coccineum]
MSSVGKFVHDSNKAPDSPPHPHTFSSNQRHCFHCKDVLGDGEFCQRCTCMRCGSGLSKGLCLICASRYGNNPNPNSLNDSPNISENVSQSPPLIDHHCCYGCGDSLDGIFCHRCTCKSYGNGAHYGYNCPSKVLIISNPEPCHNQNVDEFPQTLPSFHPTCYSGDGSSFTYDSTSNFVNDSPNVFNPPSQPPMYSSQQVMNDTMSKLRETFQTWLQQRQEQVVNLDTYTPEPSQCRKIPICYDDEESSIPLRDIIISEHPLCIAITPVLLTEEPADSLIMEDKHLDTIPATESDEVIKSSVEDLVHTPSESDARFEKFHYGYGGGYFDNPTREPRVHVPKVLPTHPTLQLDSDFTLSSDSLGSDLVVSFPSRTRNKIFDPGIFIGVQSKRFLSLDEFSISFIRDLPFPVALTLFFILTPK